MNSTGGPMRLLNAPAARLTGTAAPMASGAYAIARILEGQVPILFTNTDQHTRQARAPTAGSQVSSHRMRLPLCALGATSCNQAPSLPRECWCPTSRCRMCPCGSGCKLNHALTDGARDTWHKAPHGARLPRGGSRTPPDACVWLCRGFLSGGARTKVHHVRVAVVQT